MNTPFSPGHRRIRFIGSGSVIVFFFLFDHSKTMMIYFTKFIHKCQTKGYNSGICHEFCNLLSLFTQFLQILTQYSLLIHVFA
jgi:hypothetical protein